MVDPLMAHRLGRLMARLKIELKLTSIVVTHDTHLAETLADHVLFLDHSKVLFYGTVGEMETASLCVRAFLKDDQEEFHFADEKEEGEEQ